MPVEIIDVDDLDFEITGHTITVLDDDPGGVVRNSLTGLQQQTRCVFIPSTIHTIYNSGDPGAYQDILLVAHHKRWLFARLFQSMTGILVL
jgi:hypothetical protein